MDALASLKIAWAVLIALAAALVAVCAVLVIRGKPSAPIRRGSQGRAARRIGEERPGD